MQSIISIITGISLITLIGCNSADRENEGTNSNAQSSDFETNEMVVDPANDNRTASEPDTAAATSDQAAQPEGDTTYTETEVVQLDTVATEVVYDINRRTIEQVDTVGATATHKVERKVIKRTVIIDTLTEIVDKEQEVAFEEGNYKVVDEQVEQDTVTEMINYQDADQANVRLNNQHLTDVETDTEETTTEQNQHTATQQSQDTTVEQIQNTVNQQNQNTTVRQNQNTANEQDTTEEASSGDTPN